MSDVFVNQTVDRRAVFRRRILEAQKRTDLLQRHVQTTTMADEGQALDMCQPVDAIVALCPASLLQQAFALVVPDGFHLRESRLGQFSNLHHHPLVCYVP